MKQFEPKDVTVLGNQFHIFPFPAFKAANISGELAALIGPMLGGLAAILGGDGGSSLLDVDAGRIDVRREDAQTGLIQRCGTDTEQKQVFAAVVEVVFAALPDGIAQAVFGVAVVLCHRNGGFYGFALGFGSVQKRLVILAVSEDRAQVGIVLCFKNGLSFHLQFFVCHFVLYPFI